MLVRPGKVIEFVRVAALLLLGFVAIAIAAPPASAAVISRVAVEGNTRTDDQTVAAYLTIQPGKQFGPQDIDASIEALYQTGLFSTVSITQNGGTLLVRVAENATVNRVSFEGNRKIDDATLDATVVTRPRSTFSRAQVQEDVQRILELYRRRGRYLASVEPQTIDRGNGRVDLVFQITEGQTTNVARISFVGNRSFSDSRLRDVIKTKESGVLGFLRTTDNYDPDRLVGDQELIRRFYFDHGFADFRILSATADYDRERNAFFITFNLDEGEKYAFGSVRVDTTLADLDPEELTKKVDSRPGRRYSASDIESSLEDLTLAANRKGYPFAQVIPTGERNFAEGKIDVVYRVDQGQQAYIERIDIVGNSTTRDYVIRREFDIAEGDAFNRVLLDRAERRLRNLGFFDSVRISTTQGSAADRVIVTVSVVEKATGKVSFGIGYNTSEGVVGDLSIEEKNFLGRGQYVKASFGGGAKSQDADFSFTEPYLFGRRISGGFDLYAKLQDQLDDQSYSSQEIGGTLRLGLPINEEVTVQPFYTLFQRDVDVDQGDCRPHRRVLPIAVCETDGTRITSLAGLSLIYNSLDDQYNPREGIYAKGTTEVAGLGGDTYFWRETGKARIYQEIVPAFGVVGLASLEGGVMGALDDKLLIQDQFFLGGSKIRGFSSTGIGPRDRKSDESLGGQYYVAGTLEATFPVPFLPPEIGLSGAVFTDAGSLWGVNDDIVKRNGGAGTIVSNDFDLRASAGVGIIWKSPFGPIRADFAVPYLKNDKDQQQVFRLSGGTTF